MGAPPPIFTLPTCAGRVGCRKEDVAGLAIGSNCSGEALWAGMICHPTIKPVRRVPVRGRLKRCETDTEGAISARKRSGIRNGRLDRALESDTSCFGAAYPPKGCGALRFFKRARSLRSKDRGAAGAERLSPYFF